MIGAFRELGLSYYDYKKKKGSKWTEEVILSELEKCLKGEGWKGTSHFEKHNSALCNAIRRNMGMQEAFKKIGLNYDDYKK